MNSYTIFQCAQLLERLGAFQRSGFPRYKLQKGVAPETVDALMTKSQRAILLLKWNRRAREIESVSSKINNHFDLVRRERVRCVFKRMCGRDDLDRTIRAKSLHDPVDQTRFDQRFVTLDVDDERKLFRFACDLGNPIGSAAMFF